MATAEDLDVDAIRADFPVLDRRIGDIDLVYLDNAATTQTPDVVIDAIAEYYREYNANVHRGLHQLSQEASIAYEEAHDTVAEFIGAAGREEIVVTANTTMAENLVAYAWGLNTLGPGDEVVLTQMEHHASLVTWQQIAERTGATVRYIRIDDAGRLDMDHAREIIGPDTALASIVHVSNVLGTINPVAELADMVHEQDGLIFVDGAQAVPNRPVDVSAIDADFYAFSGHKMAGPTGIGVLYGKERLLEAMDPFLYGGEMIEKVTYGDSRWNELPWKFEAGTPPIAQAVALDRAIEYLDSIGMEQIAAHENAIAQYAIEQLQTAEGVTVYGPPAGEERGGLVAFSLDSVHAHDIASIVNDRGVAIRAGDHCTQPLHDTLGIAATARASFYVYNRREEVDALIDALDMAREIFA
ncbi:MAG: aminotransferase class V-fold PLP-dependent enzyme [Halococcoides sp.]